MSQANLTIRVMALQTFFFNVCEASHTFWSQQPWPMATTPPSLKHHMYSVYHSPATMGLCIFLIFIDPGLFDAYQVPNPCVQRCSTLCKCLIQNNRNIHQDTLGCMQGGLNIFNIVQTGPAGPFNPPVLLFLSATLYIMFTPDVSQESWHRKWEPVSAA